MTFSLTADEQAEMEYAEEQARGAQEFHERQLFVEWCEARDLDPELDSSQEAYADAWVEANEPD